MALKTILFQIYSSLFLIDFKKKRDTNDITALFEYKNSMKLVCKDNYKRRCYLVLASLIVDYKEQVFIIRIKRNMQYFIFHQKKEN